MIRRFAVMFAASFHFFANAANSGIDLLPMDKPVSARVMQVGIPPAAVKLTERFKAALASKPEWASAYVAKYKDARGGLPYHENMGLSKAEYAELIRSTRQAQLFQTGTVELSALRQPDDSIMLRTKPHMAGIDGIVIDGAGQAVTTRFARMTEVKAIDNANPDSPTGRWAGTQWRHEATAADRMLSVKFALGKRTAQGDGMLYFDLKDVGGGKNEAFSEILLFPAAQ